MSELKFAFTVCNSDFGDRKRDTHLAQFVQNDLVTLVIVTKNPRNKHFVN